MLYSVLTGDIVRSSDLGARDLDSVLSAIAYAADEMSSWTHLSGAPLTAAFARRGGDGWQIALDHPNLHLRAALFVIAHLKETHPDSATRLSCASGDGELPNSSPTNPNHAHGVAFTESGRHLDTLKGRHLMSFATPGPLGAVYLLADHIVQGWTQAQARALGVMLPPGSIARKDAAKRLGISRQAVDQSLWAAGYPYIEAALEQIEAT